MLTVYRYCLGATKGKPQLIELGSLPDKESKVITKVRNYF